MKALSTLLLTAALLPLSTVMGQQTTTPQPQEATGQQGPGARLEDDPAFQRLSPEQQDCLRRTTSRLNTGVDQKDISAIRQLKLDAAKHQIIGMSVCGHTVDEGTFVDAVTLNASSEEAIAIRWLDPKGTVVHSAIFTGRKRCVAKDGDTVDGKSILRALPNALAVSNQHGLNAWEAEYWNSPVEQGKGGAPHRGVFIENRLLVELDPHKASSPNIRSLSDQDRDFRWNDEQESLALKPGVVLVSAASPSSKSAVPSPCVAAPKQESVLGKLKRHVEQTLEKQAAKADAQIGKSTGGNVDAGLKDATTAAVNETNQPQPCSPSKGQANKQ